MLFISCNNEDIATIVAENLEKAGIRLKLNSQEMSAWQTKIMYDKNFSITMLAGYQGPDVSGIDNRVKTVGSVNIAGYKNPHLDELLGKADQYSEVKDRKQYYDEVQKILS
ncbi:hypothetical protein AOC36_01400 [Erysipelothrix larvae]|uniref:Uncharacterized protein n=1 Tax=Erysipelothrix larvae TaxID=1514105 RepID=A0A0X8GYD8_9FIRM|nr:hypothetical protein [Erysipelothrix larvae]AMC92690.1 hypothetical protein AOC36_01400 [Erysipelothrix larvae]